MTTVRRVIPRQAMTAERMSEVPYPWALSIVESRDLVCSDAEFAAAFRPAEDLYRLLAAVEAIAATRRWSQSLSFDGMTTGMLIDLCDAWQAWEAS